MVLEVKVKVVYFWMEVTMGNRYWSNASWLECWLEWHPGLDVVDFTYITVSRTGMSEA
jgi:hypothetical protein